MGSRLRNCAFHPEGGSTWESPPRVDAISLQRISALDVSQARGQSDGAMDYTLYFPFRLPAGHALDSWTAGFTRPESTLWHLEQQPGGIYAAKVVGFPNEDVAASYAARLWRGLRWLLVKKGLFAMASPGLRKVVYADDPELAARNLEKWGVAYTGPIHGSAMADETVAYPSNFNIRFHSMGTPTLPWVSRPRQPCTSSGRGWRFQDRP